MAQPGTSRRQAPGRHALATFPNLRAEGVNVVQFPEANLEGQLRSAFIEGPDRIAIEIVEGHVE